MSDAVDGYTKANDALRNRIDSREFQRALDAHLAQLESAGKRNEMGMLIENLQHGKLTSGSELVQAEKKVVFPYLEKHASSEFRAWQQAIAQMDQADGVATKANPYSSLGGHFDKLTDSQALALQPVIERAGVGLREILSVPRPRAQAQSAIDEFVGLVKKDVVKTGVSGHVADGLLQDVLGQVETRLAQAALKSRHRGLD